MRAHPGGTISRFQISELLGEAYRRAAGFGTAMNCFERSGIWPLNAYVFQEIDFVTFTLKYCVANDDGSTEKPHERVEDRSTSSTRSSTSELQEKTVNKDPVKEAGASSPETGNFKRIAEISPLPKSYNLQRKRKRATTSVTILTCSPYENILEENKGPNMKEK
jgi:hypothetical protein